MNPIERKRQNEKERYALLRSLNLCPKCKASTENGAAYCPDCRVKDRASNQAYRDRQKAIRDKILGRA